LLHPGAPCLSLSFTSVPSLKRLFHLKTLLLLVVDWFTINCFTWRLLQFNTKFHIHFLFHRTLLFHVWTKLMTQWSNELLFNEYWTQLIHSFHVSSVLLCHLTFPVTALSDHPAWN
jgi:hypothetical protein